MSKVLPFRGLLPERKLVKEVASPPYDVIDSDEARRRAQNNPNSFLHVIKPEIDLDPSIDPYDPLVYKKAKENFSTLISRGVLHQSEKPCFYIYKQIMGEHQQIGLVACVTVDEYLSGRIKKHEHTQEEKVRDRINLIQALNAQTGPVFLTYRNNIKLSEILEQCTQAEPIYDFVADYSVRHIFYVVNNDELIQNIQRAFEEIDYLYIADGHHRSEAAAQVCLFKRAENPRYSGNEEFNFFLAVIFPHSQMSILSCNRLIKKIDNYSTTEFIEKVQQRFWLHPVDAQFFQPSQPHTFGMYIDNRWYALQLKDEYMNFRNPVELLDVSILQKYLFEPILNIVDPRRDKRLEFVGGMDSVQKIKQFVDSGEFALGFTLYPVTIEQIMEVADAGLVMPPKSTWFEPKLLSGLVTHLLD